MKYKHSNIPVDVEIEGAALTPDMIPIVLGVILDSLEDWLNTVLSKSVDEKGDVHALPRTPQPTTPASSQPTPGCEP